MTVSVVGFDADDTLWHSESHFAVTGERFRALLEPWLPPEAVSERLLAREKANLEIFGYGAKGFTLSMVETALEVTGGELPGAAVQTIIDWGKELLCHPVELLDQVAPTVAALAGRYRLIVITKGDLFHQESKVAESGLADHFERVEVVSDKTPEVYRRVLERCGVPAAEFVMVGNSLRSDVLPVIDIGAHAVYVPYGILWEHEAVDVTDVPVRWGQIEHLGQLPALLADL